jgi:hypothetical protein
MTLYSLVLFVHVTAVLAMFAALSFEVLSLSHLEKASTMTEVRHWIDPLPGLPLVAVGSLLVILFSGIYLTLKMSAFGLAWPKVAMGAFLLMAPLGALTARRMRTIRRSGGYAEAFNPELLRQLRDPLLKVSLGIRIAVFLGIVLLMVAKPELWESVGIVGTSVVLGVLSSLLIWRGSSAMPAPRAELED